MAPELVVNNKWSIGVRITVIGLALALATTVIGFTYSYGKRDSAIVANKAELLNLKAELGILSSTVGDMNRELGEVHTLLKTLTK